MDLSEILSKYSSAREKADEWGVQWATVLKYLYSGKIPNAIKLGNRWHIPKDATQPKDQRFLVNRKD